MGFVNAKERAERRKALHDERKKAKQLIKRHRHNQKMYEQRKAVKRALLKGEKEAYTANIKACTELYKELRDCTARLKGARTSYDESLPVTTRLQLEYSRGWRDREQAYKQEQADKERRIACQQSK